MEKQIVTCSCPCCGAPLTYSGAEGKLVCESCGSSLDISALKDLNQAGEGGRIDFEMSAEEYNQSDDAQMQAYICKNCGAELMTDETTTATECPYCGSPAILPEQIRSGVKPQKIIPFKITKEQATKIFEEYFKGKRLLPNVFLNTRNRIAEMRKLFVPYWLFDCRADADIVYNAEKTHITREGEWEVRHTDHFIVRRAGSLEFSNIPVDGSEKMDDRISESLEPYDYSECVPFVPAMLSGAMADKADVDDAQCRTRAVERIENSMEQVMRGTVRGYDQVTVRNKRIFSEDGKVTPVLLPVWLITTEKQENGQKKTYTFAINGQTGKLTCDVPYAAGKAKAWFFGIFGGVCAIGYLLLLLLNNMGVLA